MIQNYLIPCDKAKIFFLPIPKNASSSIKNLIFYINTNIIFQKSKYRNITNIHDIYPNLKKQNYEFEIFFKKKILRYSVFTILRDPIERFLSGVNDRIIFRKAISLECHQTKKEKLDFIIFNLENIMNKNREIKWHLSPQKFFLKKLLNKDMIILKQDRNIYKKLLNIFDKNTHSFINKFNTLQHYNSREYLKNKLKASDLNEAQVDYLKNYYEEDYQIFSEYNQKII